MVQKRYLRRRNGDEYYPRGRKPFIVNPEGNERYARDRKGNEFYPRTRQNRFARDKYFREYYAQDRENNEFYPFRKGLSEVIRRVDGYQTARLANGSERYPTDARGNEYYLIQNGKPILCRQHDGKPYFARSRRRIAQIPWTVLHEYVSDRESHVATRDAVGNTVYVCRSDLRETSGNAVCRCICEIMAICPSLRSFLIQNMRKIS
ncbi:hypothetical protein AVEN_261777-1 [Araneus ventricosus]|uniref:Uncharacterized protein n=1 Tax=Araneus ventricosus TaxID=182803 RepID=A0A4Y2LZ03_ARAVE|nr:hypothetical protein AVEN_261777-1 [Araneus ventricosus]